MPYLSNISSLQAAAPDNSLPAPEHDGSLLDDMSEANYCGTTEADDLAADIAEADDPEADLSEGDDFPADTTDADYTAADTTDADYTAADTTDADIVDVDEAASDVEVRVKIEDQGQDWNDTFGSEHDGVDISMDKADGIGTLASYII